MQKLYSFHCPEDNRLSYPRHFCAVEKLEETRWPANRPPHPACHSPDNSFRRRSSSSL